MKRMCLILSVCFLISLTGCSLLDPGLDEYTLPESGDVSEVDGSYQGEIYEMTQEEHEGYELSDDFYANGGFSVSNFYSVLAAVRSAASSLNTQASSISSNYYALIAVIEAEEAGWITEEEMDEYAKNLYAALELLAEESGMELSEYLEQYSMTEDELIEYAAQRAQELYEAYIVNSE